MKATYTTSVIIGSILILGAAGGCDLGSTSLSNAVLLILLGFFLCLFGLITPRYIAKHTRSRIWRIRKYATPAITSKSKRITPTNDIAKARKSFVLIKEI